MQGLLYNMIKLDNLNKIIDHLYLNLIQHPHYFLLGIRKPIVIGSKVFTAGITCHSGHKIIPFCCNNPFLTQLWKSMKFDFCPFKVSICAIVRGARNSHNK